MTDVVLVHGAWAGGWVWDTVVGPLRAVGHRPHVVELPGVGRGNDNDNDNDEVVEVVDLDALVAHVGALVQGLEGPAVLVGHSGAGVVVTQVAELMPERVAGIVFVAGMMLPSGTDFGELCAGIGLPADVGITRWLETSPDGRVTSVPPEAAVAVFFHDAPAADAIEAARRLRPQVETARLIAPIWTVGRFWGLPRLYVEATGDRTVPIEAQRRMQQLTPGARVVTLDTGHVPQLSAPALLCAALTGFVDEVATRQRVSRPLVERHTGLTSA
ncbi:alpha/beta fold hydrolase [Rhodococcus sp. IEGM 1408]|uniref:alpha/beta fold hydrolase n=1 Tax=Rhodococcus sp. IEGM 1408 TaxID=3082220 RepID=UPI002952B774|nr:alpha/beta fold hydrolase [Rhodococcus sp. IEGM 1408]MDV8001513.1 alpha/beta fold hydrolase [Rhodococcus sp. IEGM 1408]